MKQSAYIGGGNPASAPDFKPLNPWGRMPKRKAPPPDRGMWVCNVLDRDTGTRLNIGLVGPEAGAHMLANAVRQANEKGRCWAADPQVVRILG